MNWFILTLDGFAFFLQLAAAWLSYKIYKFNRLSKGWLAIVAAFLLQALRRLVQLYYNYSGDVLSVFFDRAIMLLISFLIFIGLWSMLKNFENFEIVSSNLKSKIKKRFGKK
jgi:hypothetical protein